MTASEDGSPFVASAARDASMLSMTTAVGTGGQDSSPVFSSTFQVWVDVLVFLLQNQQALSTMGEKHGELFSGKGDRCLPRPRMPEPSR